MRHELSHQILNITSFGNAKDKILSQFSSRRLARWDSDDVFVFNDNHVFIVPHSQQYINTSLTALKKACSVVDKFISTFNSRKLNIQSDKTDEVSHQILNITSFGNAKGKILSQFSLRQLARWAK